MYNLVQDQNKLSSIFFTDDGIVICVSDEHSEKTLHLIEVTDDGIVICVNDEHFSKTHSPIEKIQKF